MRYIQSANAFHFYVEQLNGHLMWHAFQPYLKEEQLKLTYKKELWPLLAMGINGKGYPFSFVPRGFPNNTQIEGKSKVKEVCPSYLTREELLTKSAELMIVPEKEALKLRPLLIQLIKILPKTEVPKNQRIVFWFT